MFETSADSIAPSTAYDALAFDAPDPVTDPAVTSEIITLRAKLNLAPDVAIDCADIAEEAPETASKAALVAMLGAERATAAAFTTESASDIAPACTAKLIAADTPILLPATLIAEDTDPVATARLIALEVTTAAAAFAVDKLRFQVRLRRSPSLQRRFALR